MISENQKTKKDRKKFDPGNKEVISIDELEQDCDNQSQINELKRQKEMVASYFKKLENENHNNWCVNSKSGMDQKGIDRAKAIIKEASKHSGYHKSEEEKLAEVKDKVAKYRERLSFVVQVLIKCWTQNW